MNTIVSFETAKLLKEKGFDKRTRMVWLFSLGKTHLQKTHLSLELNNAEYNAPTIAEVVMWLYEKHGIWIMVDYFIKIGFNYKIINKDGSVAAWNDGDWVDSPTEAYEAAIKYTLNSLL